MGRKFVKDENGAPLWTALDNRQMAFRVAQTITEAVGLEAVATTVRHVETGEEGVGLYLCGGAREIRTDVLEKARELWLHFLH